MVCIYRKKTIKFEEREKNIIWSDQEPEKDVVPESDVLREAL